MYMLHAVCCAWHTKCYILHDRSLALHVTYGMLNMAHYYYVFIYIYIHLHIQVHGRERGRRRGHRHGHTRMHVHIHK